MFFFFKQKTAYEMRISDWSSDVCSSDLRSVLSVQLIHIGVAFSTGCGRFLPLCNKNREKLISEAKASNGGEKPKIGRRRVGKECVVRVDLGGRRIIKKKKKMKPIRCA